MNSIIRGLAMTAVAVALAGCGGQVADTSAGQVVDPAAATAAGVTTGAACAQWAALSPAQRRSAAEVTIPYTTALVAEAGSAVHEALQAVTRAAEDARDGDPVTDARWEQLAGAVDEACRSAG